MDDLLEQDVNWGALSAPAKQIALTGIDADPNQTAEARRLAQRVGAPPAAVEADPEPFKLQDKIKSMGQYIENSLELQDYIKSNPDAAKISNDDWAGLNKFSTALKMLNPKNMWMGIGAGFAMKNMAMERALHPDASAEKLIQQQMQPFIEAQGQFEAGGLTYERGSIGASRMLTGEQLEAVKQEERLKAIEKSLEARGGPKSLVGEIANMTGQMVQSIGPAFMGAMAGSVIGTPGIGTGTGALTAFSIDQGRTAAGNAYLDMMKAGLNPVAATATSILYGTVVGAVNMIGGNSVSQPVKTGLTKILENGLEKVVASGTAVDAINRGALDMMKAGALGAGLMGIQQTALELAQSITIAASNKDGKYVHPLNNAAEFAEASGRVAQMMYNGALLIGALHVPGVGVNMVADLMHVKQAQMNAKMFNEILKARDETLTFERSPELIDEFVKQHQLGTLALDPDVVAGIRKSDPSAFSFIPDIEQKLADAQETGAKIPILPNEYLKNIGGTLHEQIKDDLSINDGLTVNEAKVLEQSPPQYPDIYHGTPWDFNKVSDDKFLSGEGANTYGQGHYWTQHRGIADFYKDSITNIHQGRGEFLIDGKPEPPLGDPTDYVRGAEIDTYYRIENRMAYGDTLDEAKAKIIADLKESIEREKRFGPETRNDIVDAEHMRLVKEDYEKVIAALEHQIKFVEDIKTAGRDTPELFPQVLQGKLKVKEDEMSNLRLTVAEQGEKARKAFTQILSEVNKNADPSVRLDETVVAKDLLRLADQEIGPAKVRQIFLDNGVKAHKFETTQSIRRRGEFVDKEGKFVLGLENDLDKWGLRSFMDQYEYNVSEFRDISFKDWLKEQSKWHRDHGNDARANGIDGLLEGLKDYEQAPAHNYVVLRGDDIEITHKNDVPVGPIEMPKALDEPVRRLDSSELAALKAELKKLPDDFDDTIWIESKVGEAMLKEGYVPETGNPDGSGWFSAADVANFVADEERKARAGVKFQTETVAHAERVFNDTARDVARIAEAEQRAAGLNGIFADAKAAGMTKAEFAIYQRKLTEMQKGVVDKAFATAKRNAEKRLTPEWEAKRRAMMTEVVEDMKYDPEIMLINFLDDKKNTLDKAKVERLMGDYAGNRADYPGDIPASMMKKGGNDPDVVAGIFGYETGQQLLMAISRLQEERAGSRWTTLRDAKLDAETNRRMEAKYGTLDDAIQEAARDAALNAKAIDVLSEELKAFAKLAEMDMPFKRDEILAKAAELSERVKAGNFSYTKWTKTAGGMARRAELMLLRGKFDEAYMAKQRQMLAVIMAQEARKFEKEQGKFENEIKPYVKNESLEKVDQAYTDQIQRLLNEVFGVETKRDMNELARGNHEGLADFVEKKAKVGNQIDMPDFLRDPEWLRQKHTFEDLTVDQFRQVREMVKQLIHYGKDEKIVQTARMEMALDKAVAEMVASAGNNGGKKWSDWLADTSGPKSLPSRAMSALKYWDSILIKPERLLSWLDQRDPNGPWTQLINNPLQRAKGVANDLNRKLTTAFRALPRVEGARDLVPDSPFKTSLGRVIKTDREALIASMLNAGNHQNLKVLARGYNTTPDAVLAWIDQHATKKDWEFVQGVWDIYEGILFHEQDKAARAMTGVGLVKVEPREIQNQHGTYRGGYFPLVEDYNAIDRPLRDDPFDTGGLPPVPTANWMKRRTGAVYPLRLDLDMLPSSINGVVHYTAYAKPWKEANKVLQRPEVKQAIDDAFGLEYREQIDSFMNYVATNGGRATPTGLEGLAKGLRFMRENMVMMLIGFRPGTAVIHGGAALANSMTEAGMKPFALAAYDMMFRSPENFDTYKNFIMEKSSEIRNRKHNLDRDIGTAIDDAVAAGKFYGWRAQYISFSTALVANLDLASALPTWLAVYNKHMKEFDGKFPDAEARAIEAADQIVRNAHGANGLVDLPTIMRGSGKSGELWKYVTAFGGFFNHYYNQLRDRGRYAPDAVAAVREGRLDDASVAGGKALGGLLGYLIAGSVIHAAVRGHSDSDNIAGWLAHGVADQLAATQPFGRDIWFWWKTGHKGKVAIASPLGEVFTGLTNPLAELDKARRGKDSNKVFKTILETPGWSTGVGPSRYLSDLVNYLYLLNEGDARPPADYMEWQRLVLDAKAPPKKRKAK